jgi:hypothetical protein
LNVLAGRQQQANLDCGVKPLGGTDECQRSKSQ